MSVSTLALTFSVVLLLAESSAWRDSKADVFLKEVERKYRTIETLAAEMVRVTKAGGATKTGHLNVMLKKPNLARIQERGSKLPDELSDGRTLWSRIPGMGT